jgi:hypothetical protein
MPIFFAATTCGVTPRVGEPRHSSPPVRGTHQGPLARVVGRHPLLPHRVVLKLGFARHAGQGQRDGAGRRSALGLRRGRARVYDLSRRAFDSTAYLGDQRGRAELLKGADGLVAVTRDLVQRLGAPHADGGHFSLGQRARLVGADDATQPALASRGARRSSGPYLADPSVSTE